jgi:putative NADPH-quinone reductase
MKVSIILAHPNPGSFNHAIAGAAAAELEEQGHNVRLHDLCEEQFNPVLPTPELAKNVQLGSVIRQHCHEIVEADGIIIVHPNWWDMPPAILKGWIDRVLRPDVVYRFVTNEKGEGIPQGLLAARAAVVFNTANTPDAAEQALYGDPLETLWKKCIFGLCGVKNVQRRTFTPVIVSTPQQRAQWLAEARRIVRAQFPAEKRSRTGGAAQDRRAQVTKN